jgi:hypothetical protein
MAGVSHATLDQAETLRHHAIAGAWQPPGSTTLLAWSGWEVRHHATADNRWGVGPVPASLRPDTAVLPTAAWYTHREQQENPGAPRRR